MFNSSYYKPDQTPDSLQITGIGELQSFLSMRAAHRVIKAPLLLKLFVFLLRNPLWIVDVNLFDYQWRIEIPAIVAIS